MCRRLANKTTTMLTRLPCLLVLARLSLDGVGRCARTGNFAVHSPRFRRRGGSRGRPFVQGRFCPTCKARVSTPQENPILDSTASRGSPSTLRQALAQAPPGAQEETSPLSHRYRGLEPHRAHFTQVLKDGCRHADQFGYPEDTTPRRSKPWTESSSPARRRVFDVRPPSGRRFELRDARPATIVHTRLDAAHVRQR